MLTLSVIPSGKPNADFNKTVESFEKADVGVKVVLANTWVEVNDYRYKDKWYAVFWDNEGIDVNLQKALIEHLNNRIPDALILYKRLAEKEAEYRTRFMRRTVWLTNDYAPLMPWVTTETVLDGWVVDHVIVH